MAHPKEIPTFEKGAKVSAVFTTNHGTFLATGVLKTLTAIFKTGERSKLLSLNDLIFPSILSLARQRDSSTLLRKLLVKLFQRIGLAFLPPRVVSWAYQRGQRSLLQVGECVGALPTR